MPEALKVLITETQFVFMVEMLRYSVIKCQRQSVTEIRFNLAMNTIGDRIRWRRTQPGIDISRKDLAKASGLAYSTLADLENNLSESTTKLNGIAKHLNVRPEWLETGKKPIEPADIIADSNDGEWGDILGYSQAVGLGRGAEAQEYAETHKLKFRAESLARKKLKPQFLAVMYGNGDSMEPRIKKGDAVLFDTGDIRPMDDAIFVIQYKGEYFAKRCMILDDKVYFKADNSNGDHNWKRPKSMDSKREPISIIGRVRWIGSWED